MEGWWGYGLWLEMGLEQAREGSVWPGQWCGCAVEGRKEREGNWRELGKETYLEV